MCETNLVTFGLVPARPGLVGVGRTWSRVLFGGRRELPVLGSNLFILVDIKVIQKRYAGIFAIFLGGGLFEYKIPSKLQSKLAIASTICNIV